MSKLTLHERFWSKVAQPNENGCRLWLRGTGARGYGAFNFRGRSHAASRIALMLTTGEERGIAWFACHHCDIPLCVEPTHLFWGTQKDNMRDCSTKGRCNIPQLRGEDSARAILTTIQVQQVRYLYHYVGGYTNAELAKAYGLKSKDCMQDITAYESWRHISDVFTRRSI